MDIQKIEKILTGLNEDLKNAGDDISVGLLLSVIQCNLLLHIYKQLENIEDDVSSMSKDSWADHHNH